MSRERKTGWRRVRWPVPKKASRPMSSKKGGKGYDRKKNEKFSPTKVEEILEDDRDTDFEC